MEGWLLNGNMPQLAPSRSPTNAGSLEMARLREPQSRETLSCLASPVAGLAVRALNLRLLSDIFEALREIRNQIVHILDADRDADQRIRQSNLLAQFARNARMRH
jgi:hypothetical protein